MLIDTFTPDWQDHLIKQQSELAPGRRLFLLLDGAFVPNLYREVQKALTAPDDVALLFEQLPGCTDNTRSVSPFLAPYSGALFLMTLALKKCSGWPMVSAIETTETMADLRVRLGAWCVIENDGQRFNFRFPDTRRLPAIFDCLTIPQRGSLVGPAVRWSYIGRTGAWRELPLPQSTGDVAEEPTLDDTQFAALVGDSEVDETIVLLRDRGRLPAQLLSNIYANVQAAMRIATLAKLDQDLHLDWCSHCLKNGVPQEEHDAVKAVLEWHATRLSNIGSDDETTEPF
jgi:hypothetical protein